MKQDHLYYQQISLYIKPIDFVFFFTSVHRAEWDLEEVIQGGEALISTVSASAQNTELIAIKSLR